MMILLNSQALFKLRRVTENFKG